MLGIINVETFLQAVLAMIMLSVGLSLTTKDFQYIIQNPRITIGGLFLKMFCFPFIGVAIANLFGLSITFQLGIFILLICPGGTTSNLITYWFSGNKALTIALTTIASFIAVVTIPILTNWAHTFYFGDSAIVKLPVMETIANIFIVMILPVLTGMLFRWRYERPSDIAERVLKYVSVVLLGVVYAIKFFASKENGGTEISKEELFTLLPVLLVINIVGLVFGFLASKFFKMNTQDSMTIGIEVSLENVSLAIVVGSVLLHNEDLVKPGLIYAMFSFWTAMGFAVIVKKLFFRKKWA
ncbi:MAG: bile acid:sodium symporter family protein [Saprospiraceae bacterium]|nr:bile acid:sodium symporter family protein [Saprospiraceae bacterium]MCF8251571.1 bile acid:sodium symporter family protein [Saprospiraceae bacterium]MCF8282828.1 bile acid:sodium symporter family protein [Bacteroidales bacterium]MCF8313466.1 bile acid:sodium symporter family protein [Saprospiraceae bacterium]MCF8442207.1 bile acid:sodium symporter family protein [Saprospiraceae bacterium]